MVLWFHASGPLFRGGFIGVDIFFVLSGYLITALLLEEHDRDGSISLWRFYARRALRLLPALMVLLIAYAGYHALWGEGVSHVLPDILMVLFYGANWARAYNLGLAHSLSHTWSLAIEEQFYILWPLLLMGMLSLGLRRKSLLPVMLIGALASATWRGWLFLDHASPMRLYNGLDTRCTGLLLGCALAVYLHDQKREPAPTGLLAQPRAKVLTASAIGAAATLLVLSMAVKWSSPYMFLAGYLQVACATTLVIAGLCLYPQSKASRLMQHPMLVSLGQRSYGVYLWHYPIYHSINIIIDTHGIPVRWPIKLFVGGSLAVLIASLSYRWIETPVQRLKSRLHRHVPEAADASLALDIQPEPETGRV